VATVRACGDRGNPPWMGVKFESWQAPSHFCTVGDLMNLMDAHLSLVTGNVLLTQVAEATKVHKTVVWL